MDDLSNQQKSIELLQELGLKEYEATDTLRDEYRSRMDSLRDTLESLDPAGHEEEADVTHEVWSLSDPETIVARTQQLIDDAADEVVLVLGDESVFTDSLAGALRAADRRGVDVIVGTSTEDLYRTVAEELPAVDAFVSNLGWLHQSSTADDHTEITRLLLIDRSTVLVSVRAADTRAEQAVFGRGFDNGLVAI